MGLWELGGGGGLSSAWVSVLPQLFKNPRAGLGMPARPKLLRRHLRPLVNHSMKAGPGGYSDMCVLASSCECASCKQGSGDTPGILCPGICQGYSSRTSLHPLPTVGWMYSPSMPLEQRYRLRDSDTRLMEGEGGPMRCPQGHYFLYP